MIERLLSLFRRSPAWPSDPQEADRLFEAIVAGVGDPQTAIDHLREMPRDEVVRRLIDLIARDNPGLRLPAAKVLRKMREPRAVDVLAQALEHPSDWRLRSEAIEALGEIGDSRALESLLAKFEDETEDDGPRALAAYALAQIGAPAAIEPLERVVAGIPREILEEDAVGGAAREAVSQLRAMHPDIRRATKPRAGYLLKRLTNSDPDVRVKAVNGLRRRADASTVETLIRILADDVPAVRAAAAEALGTLADARAIAPLTALTRDVAVATPSTLPSLEPRGVLVCDKASMALGKLGGPEAEAALLDALTSESADVRMAAADALGNTHRSRRVLEVLARLLDDPDPEVRRCAVQGLGDWQVPARKAGSAGYSNADVLAVLDRAFRDPDEHVRDATLNATGKFGDRAQALAMFQKALADTYWLVRRGAVHLLGVHRGYSALPRIREMLSGDEDDGVRGEAAQAIGFYFARAEDMDALVAALDDSSPTVRAMSAYAIGGLYDQHQGPHRHAVPRLLELAEDPDGRVQENARTTLIKLGIGV